MPQLAEALRFMLLSVTTDNDFALNVICYHCKCRGEPASLSSEDERYLRSMIF